ncbi:hypothetical protein [Acerihabitans arboris]|uniref:NAD(+)--protein-arginine ADP-ribosyltransferase n=1 Tax=Acerihabitans arboris TaxID=2691583 RepID=A0A845SCD0_9GAMM|nr:hypothetical protein [Acerihabitans arboris]NDL62523.1 hypothetical protein [Acerihabitans arboris]
MDAATQPQPHALSPYAAYPAGINNPEQPDAGTGHAATDAGAPYRDHNKRRPADDIQAGTQALALQNEHVAFYLQKTGIIRPECGMHHELLINRVIDCLTNPGTFLPELTRALMTGSGLFGAQPEETLSVDHQLEWVKQWIAANVFGGSVDEFLVACIIAGIPGKTKQTSRQHMDNAMLLSAVDHHVASLSTLTVASVEYIFNEILLTAMPTLGVGKGSSLGEADYVGSLDWVYLHAGVQFAHEMRLESDRLSKYGLLSLGVSLEATLLSNTVSPGIIQFFIRPAVIYFLVNKLIDGKPITDPRLLTDPAVRQRAVEHFFADSRLRNEKNNPFTQYSLAIEGYRTRTQLAEDILHDRCAMDATGHYAVDAESYKNNYDGYSCKTDNGGPLPTIELLPNVSDEFRKQNRHIVEYYRAVDTLLLAGAFNTLSAADTLFFEKNQIKLATAYFSSFDQFRGVLGAHTIPRSTYIIHLSADAVLFSTTGAGERIYALERRHGRHGGYGLTRIDRDTRSYYALLDDQTPRRDRDYLLKIAAGGSQATVLKPAGESLDGLIRGLSGLAQENLRTQLDVQGYDATTREKVLKGLLSLVPLHDCISGIIAGDREAVVPCVFDMFSLLPLLGKAGSMVSRMAIQGGKGTAAAVRISLGSYAARQSLDNALSAGAGHFVKYAMVPAAGELNQKAFIAMAVELARFADPAMVEILYRSSAAATRRLSAAIGIIAGRLPEIAPILPKITKLADAGGAAGTRVSYRTARLAGTNRYLPIAPLDGDKYRGKAIYVQIDPQSGNFKGKKYTLSDDNQLIPVPRPAAIHLKNVLREGLGGKGGNKAVRVWNSQRSFDDMVLVDLPQYPNPQYLQIESYGSREAETLLFPELGIPLQQTPLDIIAYAQVFEALDPSQKLAIRAWTMVEGDTTRYHDGTKNLARMVNSPVNAEINLHLFEKVPRASWEIKERLVYAHLLASFNSPLPRQSGSFLRVAEYRGQDIPWADTIGPGDIVTNYPGVMSVASNDDYVRLFTEQTAEEAGEGRCQALVYYKIHGGANCLPLPYPIASTVETENELIFGPKSFFRVTGISRAELIGGELYPLTRFGVVLVEVEQPVASAKNLFTGEVYYFN